MHQPVQLSQGLLTSLIETAERCGGNRNECIVYVTAAADWPHEASGFIHPRHASSPISTIVEFDELNRVWDELRDASRKIVMQVHTHPGGAFHSSIDDGFPIIHSVGFPSLVLPFFGRNGVEGAHLAIYQGDGQWLSPNLNEWDRYLVIENGH